MVLGLLLLLRSFGGEVMEGSRSVQDEAMRMMLRVWFMIMPQ